MQPVICPTNKADHGPDDHGAKLVNSNGQCPDYSSAKAIDISAKHNGDPNKYFTEEIPGTIPGQLMTMTPRVPDAHENCGSPGGFSDC